MSKSAKYAAIGFGVAVVAFLLWSIYRTVKSGINDAAGILAGIRADFKSALGVVTGAATSTAQAASDVATAAALPNSVAQSQALDTVGRMMASDYAPGGKTYNAIVASQGQAAAESAWSKVQADYQVQADQTASAVPSWYNPWSW